MTGKNLLAALAFAAVAVAALPDPAASGREKQESRGLGIDPARRYEACMALTRRNPEQAFGAALAWRDMGGGEAADHCTAAALMGLKQYGEAARRFESLAQRIKAEPPFKAALLADAAQGWIMDGRPGRAENVLTAALGLKPGDPKLLVDRATARAGQGAYAKAIEDLDRAIEKEPGLAEAFVFRASAKRFLGDLAGALKDADRALRFDPRQPEGLLERGIIRRLMGNKAEARKDWLNILDDAPGTPAARAARDNLEKMDLKVKQD
ncbi:MAG TPA: tetratricopeptide repeat protein [Alphaproteobacteria bacterium]|mgnify:CR=1 FL=1|nr:tetratricopeptide repeat protein [Alphaproteobacteria bacterium]